MIVMLEHKGHTWTAKTMASSSDMSSPCNNAAGVKLLDPATQVFCETPSSGWKQRKLQNVQLVPNTSVPDAIQ